jgi:mobilization protein NikA
VPNNEMLHFRATPREAQSIRERAKEGNLSVSDFLRRCVESPPQAPVCDECSETERCIGTLLELIQHRGENDSVPWNVGKFRELLRLVAPRQKLDKSEQKQAHGIET